MPKPQLIEIVEMGPWKHKVDKGADARKAAYETMYTLVCDTSTLPLLLLHYLLVGHLHL
jgi:cullin-associated NEDD8-dissociated protein 1